MRQRFNIQDSETEGVITIEGTIGSEGWWDGNNNTFKRIADEVKKMTANVIRVKIHSLGGYIDDGYAMHDLLVQLDGKKVITEMTGLCASAATVVAMAGSERVMTKNAYMLIHRVSSFVSGNTHDMEKTAEEPNVVAVPEGQLEMTG